MIRKLPFTVRLTGIFLLLNALVWLVFGLIIALGLHPALHFEPVLKWGMAFLSFIASGVLFILIVLLFRRWKPAWYLSVAALAVSSLLTVFDDFGWIDLVVLLLMLIPLGLLIFDRKWYLGKITHP